MKVKKIKRTGSECMYLDPGFGGMLVQVVVVLIAVGGAILFSLRKKLSQLFSRSKSETQPIENQFTSTNENEDDAVDVLDD